MNRLLSCTLTACFLLGSQVAQAECDSYHALASVRSGTDKAKELAYYEFDTDQALQVFEQTEQFLSCMTELIPTSDLTALSLHKGAVLIDKGQEAEGMASIARAAGVSARITFSDSSLNQNTNLLFLQQRDQRFLLDRASIEVQITASGQIFALDGQPVAAGQTIKAVTPGEHFFQIGQAGKWQGHWIELPEGGPYRLSLQGDKPDVEKISVTNSSTTAMGSTTSEQSNDWVKPTVMGLSAAAGVAAGVFIYQEALYRSGALYDESGNQVEDYASHLRTHRISAIFGATFAVGAIGVKIVGPKLGPEQSTSRGAKSLYLVASPKSIGLTGRF